MSRSTWSLELDEDVFSYILSFIFDSHTIYKILIAIPTTNPFFSVTLNRLCELPIFLSSDGQSSSGTLDILDRLLSSSDAHCSEPASSLPVTRTPASVVDAIRYLIITLTFEPPPAVYERLAELLSKARNLRILDWEGSVFPSADDFNTLQTLEQLKTLRLYASADETDRKLDHFACTLGPLLNSLELRSVDMQMYRSLESQYKHFSSYHSLHHFSIDITAGTWDWDHRGSPQMGASDAFIFKNLGFPALTEFEMQVSDLTINAERPGPMELVNWEPLKYLRLKVVHCFTWTALRNIRLFGTLSPQKFSSLSTLQIDDETWKWAVWEWGDELTEERNDPDFGEIGRYYCYLVPRFLASIQSGFLQNLVNLLVDQKVLCMPITSSLQNIGWAGEGINFYTVKDLWHYDPAHDNNEEQVRRQEWVATLRAIFEKMESLRVGLGEMDDVEVGMVLGCCSPSKLKQFGFHWNWQAYGHEDPISSKVLGHFSRFPNLTDIHILLPRPGTQKIFASPDPAVNFRTIDDIKLIFTSNPSLCRVGIGRNTVWERQCFSLEGDTRTTIRNVILGHEGPVDERLFLTEAIPRFYDAGALGHRDDGADPHDQSIARPSHSAEIEELRSLLERIL